MTDLDRNFVPPAWFEAALPTNRNDCVHLTLFEPRETEEEEVRYRIRIDAVLGRLKGIVVALKERYGWDEWHSIPFVLAGTPPPGYVATAKSVKVHDEEGNWQIRHIEIKADPTISPREVAALFALARKDEKTRSKNLSQKHADLALFAAERNDGRRWEDVMTDWNQLNPDLLYNEIRNFIRDCRTAYQRIMRRKLQWQRPRGGAARQGE